MEYTKTSVPGQLRESCKMTKKGLVRYIEDGRVVTENNDPHNLKNVIILDSYLGIATECEGSYGVAVKIAGKYGALPIQFKTRQQASNAALGISLLAEDNYAAVVYFNRLPKTVVDYTDEDIDGEEADISEDDPEEYERQQELRGYSSTPMRVIDYTIPGYNE